MGYRLCGWHATWTACVYTDISTTRLPREKCRSLKGLLLIHPQWANYQVFLCKSLISEEKYLRKLDWKQQERWLHQMQIYRTDKTHSTAGMRMRDPSASGLRCKWSRLKGAHVGSGRGLLPLLPGYLCISIFSHRHYGFHKPFPAAKLIGVCCQVESCQAFNYILLGVQSPVGIDALCVEISAYYYFIAISPNGSAVIIIKLTLPVMNS